MNVTFTTIVTRIVSDQDEKNKKRAFYAETFTKDHFQRDEKDYNGTMKDFLDALTDSYIPIGMVRTNYTPQIFYGDAGVRTLTNDEIYNPVQEFIQSVRPTYRTLDRLNFTITVTLAARLESNTHNFH